MAAVTRLDDRTRDEARATSPATGDASPASPDARTVSAAFLASPVRYQDVGTAEIAYRTFGRGEPLLLVHGAGVWGFTYRKLIPYLADRYTCYVVDLPGAGDTRWRPGNDFSFSGQTRNLLAFADRIGLGTFGVVAHDTGGTIARALALLAPTRVTSLALIGTEIPGHRPPWIPFFQRVLALPGASMSFGALLSIDAFVRSPMLFGNVFADRSLLDDEFFQHNVQPLRASAHKREGQIRYLRGIDWAMVDGLAEGHRRLTMPVLLIWGEDDTIFPVERARAMAAQLPRCRFVVVPRAKLFVQEEQPRAVADELLRFLAG